MIALHENTGINTWTRSVADQLAADGFTVELLGRLDNATDKVHVGSVIVNDANGRYFEPGTPRAWWLGLRLAKSLP